jgi:methylase of polypeptide subunit release factors
MDQLTFKNGTHIKWNQGDDGGGSAQYVDFIDAVGTGKKYNKGLEWCAGLSAIAFSLLDAEICDKITLMDIYEPALIKAKENAEKNNIGDRVNYYVLGNIGDLPIDEKFDLVVANPPHCEEDDWMDKNNNSYDDCHRITIDLGWNLHKEFYANITKHLNPGADVYISQVTRSAILEKYQADSGLVLVEEIPAKFLSADSKTDAFITHFKYEEKVY